MSFKLGLNPRDKASGRFISKTHRALSNAAALQMQRNSVSQKDIAAQLDLDKSTVSKTLNGEANLTLKTISDFSWALGMRPEINFIPINPQFDQGTNWSIQARPVEAIKMKAGSGATLTNIKVLGGLPDFDTSTSSPNAVEAIED